MSSDLVSQAKSLITDLKVLVYEEENWSLVLEQEGVKVFRKESSDSMYYLN